MDALGLMNPRGERVTARTAESSALAIKSDSNAGSFKRLLDDTGREM